MSFFKQLVPTSEVESKLLEYFGRQLEKSKKTPKEQKILLLTLTAGMQAARLFLLLFALWTLFFHAESYVYGWLPAEQNKNVPPLQFVPGASFEFDLVGEASDLYVNISGSLGFPVNISLCSQSPCTERFLEHAFALPQLNHSYEYQFLDVLPSWDSTWFIPTVGEKVLFGFEIKPKAIGTLNVTISIDSTTHWLIEQNHLDYECLFTKSDNSVILKVPVSSPDQSFTKWKCTVPAAADFSSYPEGTKITMNVQQTMSSDGMGDRLIPSIAGPVKYETGAVVISHVFPNCAGSNVTFFGQFSLDNMYSCDFDPYTFTQGTSPVSLWEVVCPIPLSLSKDGPLTYLALNEKDAERNERVVYKQYAGLPKITNCANNDGGKEDRTIPYWAWTVFGVGLAGLVIGAVLVIAAAAIACRRKRPGTGGYEMVVEA